jgi:hypothetical protein
VEFPNDGATSAIDISRVSPTTFNLESVGTYVVMYQASIDEAGQLAIALNGVQIPHSVAGRATGTSEISNFAIVTTTAANSTLSVINPAGNATALTVTPSAGGTSAASANLVIIRLA